MIDTALRGRADHVGEANVLLAGNGTRWVGANIYDADGARISNADVWIFYGPVPYALSGSAREYSALLDGRHVGEGASAGDDEGTIVQDCTQVR